MTNRSTKNLDRAWKPMKGRVLYLMSELGSLPHLSRVPITRALKRLPAKVFAIQIHSALKDSIAFDGQKGIRMVKEFQIPVRVLKSERDPVASFVQRLYQNCGVDITDVTNPKEKNLFREHLYHMVHPVTTAKIIDEFVQKAEFARKES
ncbi:MAG TPA: hypothetical protein ENJ82_14470 [Bacteroidetes bacterium]|nr:hypothetical protein [Bacteroidota bacterium]